MTIATVNLAGASGHLYEFEVHDFFAQLNRISGVYAVTVRKTAASGEATHTLIYVGQTESLPEFAHQHPKEACFAAHGANCVCIHRDRNEVSRRTKVKDLIRAYKPVCNPPPGPHRTPRRQA
jgi:hypothetical protein